MNNRYTKRGRNRSRQNKLSSSLDPQKLIHKAVATDETVYTSRRTYVDFRLHPSLSKNLAKKKYIRPTEIQDKSIEKLIKGENLIGVAATGTGKTGAFLIPIVQQMMVRKQTSALVIVPTRELAQQVQQEYDSLTKGMQLPSSCFIGGTNVGKDISKARKNFRFIVGTPGRLNDLIDRNSLNISSKSILVLDEFDTMLDMGFVNDIRRIVSKMRSRKQTMLFSATVDRSQEKIIKEIVHSALRINVTSGTIASDRIEQDIIKIAESENKFDVLLNLLDDKAFKKVILFAETKRMADKISRQLKKSGVKSDAIHGDKSQSYRNKAIQHFKVGQTKILVATDVASRGIDIDNVSHVINYQLPRTMDSYIHRIGRTGRKGKTGMAYTFVN